MAEASNGATISQTTSHIPIAQLTPLLTATASRSIKAVVTLTWPYSSATGSMAFLLSEPDFRLRRTRGQVRVQFSGSSAKEVAKSGIASGDLVILSLDGVEWIHDEATVATPGRGVEFELKFTERLFLQFQQEDRQDVKTIDIDHPEPEPEVAAPLRIPTPELAISPSAASTHTSPAPPVSTTKVGDEWISPAFIKRARTSYGSLFDSDYDPFAEEDGTVRGKGRKRTRLSSRWRYNSRSPTPEAEEELAEPIVAPSESVAKPSAVMMDEGCQTIGLEDGGAAEALANLARQATNVGRDSYIHLNGTTTQKSIFQNGAALENTLSATGPPVLSIPHSEMDGLQQSESDQNAPRSPHLQPVSSDFLPQVSPLVSSGGLPNSGNLNSEVIDNGQSLHGQPHVASSPPPIVSDEAEDLYGASPAGRRGEQIELDVAGFEEPATLVNGEVSSVFENHFVSEDQYGHWQSSTAQLSHHASPYRTTEPVGEDAHDDRFYVEEGEGHEHFIDDGYPTSHTEMIHSHQYPEIDDGLPSQHSPGWGDGTANVLYPDLQGHSLESGTTLHPSHPQSAAMSRSESAQSQVVVDLTESSDEEDEEQPQEGSIGEEESIMEGEEEENLDESVGDDEEGSLAEEQEERPADIVRSRHFPRDAPQIEEDFEGDEEDQDNQEDYYDDDLEEDEADSHLERFNVGPGQAFYDEEEEESYEDEDEDIEDHEAPSRSPVQQHPVVIDLLSSDDEDNGLAAEVTSTISASPRHPQVSAQFPHENEQSDEEEDVGDENDVTYAERSELKTELASRDLVQDDSVEEEDVMEDERDLDGGDESVREDESDAENEDESSREVENPAAGEQSLAQDLMEESEEIQPVQHENEAGDELVDVESVDHLESETIAEPAPTEFEGRVETAISGQFGRSQTSPSSSSVFARMLNFDGANDDPDADVSYPTLPRDELSPPASDQHAISQTSENLLQKTRKAQLPTPDATQSFGKLISPETSFASATDIQPSQTELQHGLDANTSKVEIEQVEITVDESRPLEVEATMEQTETTAVTIETSKITIDEEDIQMTQEGDLETIAEPKSTDIESLEEQNVDESLRESSAKPKPIEIEPAGQMVISEEPVQETARDYITFDSDLPKETENLDLVANGPILESAEDSIAIDMEHPQEIENLDMGSKEPVLELDKEITALDSNALKEIENLDAVVDEAVLETAEDTIAVDSNPRKETRNLDVVAKEPEFTIDSPRRSHRRGKPTVTAANTKENVRPITPKKAENGDESVWTNPRVMLDSRTPPKGHDASIELALSSLNSPSKQQHDLRKQPVADLKLRLSRALRTELSEFTSLKVLRYHLNQKLDVLAVATTTPAEPLRAKNGPRHYQITFNITDPSISPSGVTEVQIFRPYKDALPTIKAGDGILLRNFQVISVKSRGFGLRSAQDEGSSWAVFKEEGDAEVRGPPVEFGEGEKNHVNALKAWYETLDATAMAKIHRANGDKAGSGVGKSIAKAS